MVKIFHVISVVALIFAGILLWLSGVQLLQGGPQDKHDPVISISGRLRALQDLNRNSGQSQNPLLEQAAAFALYLTPPKPPHVETPRPKLSVQPAARPATAALQFKLLLTSYRPSSPEESWALVSEPGKGHRWTKKGDRLGHFVVESVGNGLIIYQDGNQLRKMTITVKEPAALERLKSTPVASIQSTKPDVRFLNAARSNESGRRTPDAQPKPYTQE